MVTGYLQDHELPPGVTVEPTSTGFVLKSSTRSVPAFVLSAVGLGSIFVYLHSKFGFDFSALFAAPWPLLAVGVLGVVIYLVIFCGMALWGEVTVKAEGEQGSVFAGIGTLGLGREFLWADITGIAIRRTHLMNISYRLRPTILKLDGPGRISFGGLLGQKQQAYILGVIQQRLRQGTQPEQHED